MKTLLFTQNQILDVVKKHPTPFHIYDAGGIRKTAKELTDAFAILPAFKNYFAVKALPNPHIMRILFEEGMGMDTSSLPELLLCEKLGIKGESIMFSSNDTPFNEYQKAYDLGAFINLDDISQIAYLQKHVGLPPIVCLRYNPGSKKSESSESFIMGTPEETKFGMTKKQLREGYALLKKKGVKRFGLHAMIASNELSVEYLTNTADLLFSVAAEIARELSISFEFVNLGGGIGIPYRPSEKPVSFKALAHGVRKAYEKALGNGLAPFKVFMENGRVITGPHGYLVTTVLHLKETYKKFVGVDASMANLMRPGMYGAYHHITVLNKDGAKKGEIYDVVGSLCENNDKFAINRSLPKIDSGDILIIHDTGAHGHAMGFNYNGKLRSAELLLNKDGKVKLIRRSETVEDYFATLVD